jgi:hypothetical protein
MWPAGTQDQCGLITDQHQEPTMNPFSANPGLATSYARHSVEERVHAAADARRARDVRRKRRRPAPSPDL